MTQSQRRRHGNIQPSSPLLLFAFMGCVFRNMTWVVFGSFLCHLTYSDAFATLVHHRHPRWMASSQSLEPKDAFLLPFVRAYSHRSRHFMSTKSSSKTGGRLLESTEDYTKMVLDNVEDRPILVFWTAPWCGPCRLSIPVVKDIMKVYSDQMDTVEVCTDDLPDLAANAGVVSIPTIHICFRGKLLDTLVGCVAKQVLAGSVEKVLEDITLQRHGRSSQFSRPHTRDFDDFSP